MLECWNNGRKRRALKGLRSVSLKDRPNGLEDRPAVARLEARAEKKRAETSSRPPNVQKVLLKFLLMAGCVARRRFSSASATRCDCDRCDCCYTCCDSNDCRRAETCRSACPGCSCTGCRTRCSLSTSSGSPCPAGRLLRLLRACIDRDKDESEYHKQNSHPGSHSFFHNVPPCP